MKVIHNMRGAVDKLEKRKFCQVFFDRGNNKPCQYKAIKTNRLRLEKLLVVVKSRIEEVD